MRAQIIEKEIEVKAVMIQLTKDFVARGFEKDHYYWLKIDFKALNPYNVSFKFGSGFIQIIYLIPSALVNRENVLFENEICAVNLPLPKYIDFRNYEKRIEKNSIVFVFYKRFAFANMEYFDDVIFNLYSQNI
jgi:hypothetical protein